MSCYLKRKPFRASNGICFGCVSRFLDKCFVLKKTIGLLFGYGDFFGDSVVVVVNRNVINSFRLVCKVDRVDKSGMCKCFCANEVITFHFNDFFGVS